MMALHRTATFGLLLCLLASPVVFTGFMSRQYAVVGVDQAGEDTFVGTIDHNPLTGNAKISVKARKTGIQCSGRSDAPGFRVTGKIKGTVEMTCNDGRKLKGSWEAENFSRGSGSGQDDQGNPFYFTFGSTTEEAQLHLEKIREVKAQSLPPAL